MVYGRPCSINDLDCDVSMVQNLDDTTSRHPKFCSMEITDDGISIPVTIFTYQRFKFKLYRIASPILSNVYFLRGATKARIVERIGNIHKELLLWFSSLPDELILGNGLPISETSSTLAEKTFRLQALALQLAYDNIMILLHRPLLQYTFDDSSWPPSDLPRSDTQSDSVESPTQRAQAISKNQCWESAIRTSNIIEHLDILRLIRNTHAAAYTGIHMFTAGVMLSVVALSQPLSSEAQEAKKAIARVIKLSKALGHQTLLSAQGGNILQSLVRVILAKEMKELLSEENADDNDGTLLATANHTPCPPSPIGVSDSTQTQHSSAWSSDSRLLSTQSHQSIYDTRMSGLAEKFDGGHSSDLLGHADFNEGFLSVQEGKQ